jgi:hypothetical protein
VSDVWSADGAHETRGSGDVLGNRNLQS